MIQDESLTSKNLYSIVVSKEEDILTARKKARETAKIMGFNPIDQSRIVTIISELARNIYKYAGDGKIIMEVIKDNFNKGLSIQAIDNGPGIADVQLALEQGYSTSGSLGAGLPAVRRMVDEFTIETEVGKGSHIKLVKWI